MTALIHEIDFGEAGNAADYVLDGFGTPEGAHTWSVGHLSRLRLPIADPDPDATYTLTIWAAPWLHPPEIARQTVMLGIDDRLIATIVLTEDSAFAFDLPPLGAPPPGGHVVTLGLLESARSAQFDTYRDGRSMGLMMRFAWLYRRAARMPRPARALPPIPGAWRNGQDQSLPQAIERATGAGMADVLGRFESLGQNCRFAEVQQEFGVDHLGLLRFAGIHQAELVFGLMRRFSGIGRATHMNLFHSDALPDQFDVHDRTYRIWWHTYRTIHETDAATVFAAECLRIPYLQRKFARVLTGATRIFVFTVPAAPCEILAVFAALDLWARNTLLFVTQSGERPAGSVEMVQPGLLCGYLDTTDLPGRGSEDAWLSILGNAFMMV